MNAKPNQALDNDDDVALHGVTLEHVIVEIDSLKLYNCTVRKRAKVF